MLTPVKALLMILVSSIVFSALGALAGYLIATLLPGYYENVFAQGNWPNFDPVVVGIGQGLTQGMVAGLVVGIIVVLGFLWRDTRLKNPGPGPD